MFISPAYAQAAGAAGQSGGAAGAIVSLLPLVLIFVVFYFLMIRPQQKRMKELQNAVNSVKKGDRVVTGGGLIGKVTKVEDREVEIELGTNVRVRAIKATLAEVIPAGTGKPAND
ncbi:preprotein translocase subunit YajC [Sphingomonas soli]|uniref:preprotein translocase subunit YajC n=1 Tax=Sphingomonas soli TaxID=266127 RepID=UPI000831F8C4|nr:preprotein translocase subunit YajC [Sphingomonas soli]